MNALSYHIKDCLKDFLKLLILISFTLLISHTSYSRNIIDSTRLNKISSYNDNAFDQININPKLAFAYVDSSIALNNPDSISHKELSKSYTILGILNKNKGFYQIAVTNYLKALHSSETLGDWKRVSVYYNNIGVIYHLNGKYKDALTYYRNSIKIEKSVDSKKQLAIRYYNMGETFQALNEFDSSYHYYKTSLSYEMELENNLGINYALYGLSNLYLSEQNFDSSEYYMNIIDNRLDTLNDLELECKILVTKTQLNIKNELFTKALKHILRAKSIAQRYGYKELLIISLEQLNIIYEKTKSSSKQIEVLNELNEIQKDRYKSHVTIKISELQKLYEQESQKREIDQLRNSEKINQIELNHSKKVKTYLFLTVFVVILIFIFNIISLNRLRNRNN